MWNLWSLGIVYTNFTTAFSSSFSNLAVSSYRALLLLLLNISKEEELSLFPFRAVTVAQTHASHLAC